MARSPSRSMTMPEDRAWLVRLMAAYLFAAGWWRVLRFLSVSGLCFALQFSLVHTFYVSGVRPGWLCDAYGFAISTQVNAVLTMAFTFRDFRGWRRFTKGWLMYNGVALVSLGLNAAVFSIAHPLAMSWFDGLPILGNPSMMLLAATVAGAVAGWTWSFPVCRLLFTKRAHKPPLVIVFEGLDNTHAVGSVPGVAVVMPAYKENEDKDNPNLRVTVEGALAAFAAAGIPCTVGICTDGGPDGTPELASRLVAEYPGRVVVAHHRDREGRPNNQGYGRAVKTALGLGLTTGHEYVVKVDSDPQFLSSDLVAAYQFALGQRAEAVFGYRLKRQDGWKRGAAGKLWTWGSNVWIRPQRWIRDVDCSVKVFWAKSLIRFKLVGHFGMMGAELAAWTKALGLHMVQFGVEHLPRADNHNQTGLNKKVVLGTFASLPAVYRNLVTERLRWRRVQWLVRPKDVPAYLVTLVAGLVSVISFVFFYKHGVTIDYPDAAAHLEIADRVWVFHSAAQFGAVWLPLVHLLDLWGVWNPTLYYTGIAGSAVSMVAFVVTVRYLFKLTRLVSGHTLGGIVAAAVLLTNGNLLFLQSTPMTESVMFATVAAGVYYLTMWARTDDWHYLAISSFAIMLGCATRYEDWWFAATMSLAAAYIAWRKRNRSWAKVMMVAFGSVTAIAVLGWVVWGLVILHSPFYFLNGTFAKPDLWVAAHEPAIHHWGTAAMTYWYATVDNLGLPVILAAAAGLLLYALRTRLRPEALPPLTLLTYAPFFIEQLEKGERPLHVMQVNGSLYNERFALGMVMSAGLLIGYLATQLADVPWTPVRRLAPVTALAVLPALVIGLASAGIPVTLREGISFRTSAEQIADARTAAWLKVHYPGGLVLMEGFDNVSLLFDSHVPTANVVYEGSNVHNQWAASLRFPTQLHINVIVMREAPSPDQVWVALHNAPELRHDYHLVYHGANQLIYVRGPATKPVRHLAASRITTSTTSAVSTSRPTRHLMPSYHRIAGRPHYTRAPRRHGLAAWYEGRPGTCIAAGYTLGSWIRVVSARSGAQAVCQVISNKQNLPGRVVTLARADFGLLAPPATGLVSIYIVPTRIGKR